MFVSFQSNSQGGNAVQVTSKQSDKIEETRSALPSSDQGRRGVGRELNLTWRTLLPEQNEIVEGQWWHEDSKEMLVSVEESIAERLEIKMGDELTFLLGSQEIVVQVTNIRKANWQSMKPNFFMIFSPAVLADYPTTYISSVNLHILLRIDILINLWIVG